MLEPSDDMPSSQMLLCTMGPLAAAGEIAFPGKQAVFARKWLRWGVYVAIATAILFLG